MVLPVHMQNPYFGYDWAEFPVVNVEPLHCFYPPFQTGLKASVEGYLNWAKQSISKDSLVNLKHQWLYQHPDKRPSQASTDLLLAKSDAVVEEILEKGGAKAVQLVA